MSPGRQAALAAAVPGSPSIISAALTTFRAPWSALEAPVPSSNLPAAAERRSTRQCRQYASDGQPTVLAGDLLSPCSSAHTNGIPVCAEGASPCLLPYSQHS